MKPTDAYLRIWNTVSGIPKGKVSTYGAIARKAGFGNHARLVGYALHALPDGSEVPWHRVINARGEISERKAGRAGTRQRELLRKEGLEFRRGKIDLDRFGWPR
ncbi:MAG: MGMT family protein [Ignavibacteria bacterium]|nr:MGMT family protein [Ignavibacteria bacterium]